jgi:hypothetical protein
MCQGSAFLPFIGVRSQSMRWTMMAGAICGCLLGYWLIAAWFSGKGRDLCLAVSKWCFGFCWLPALAIIVMLAILEPDTARSIGAEKIQEFLVSSSVLPNAIGFGGFFWGTFLIVGSVVLTSSTLWTYQPTPSQPKPP